MFHLTAERPDHAAEIETLLDRAFGPDRLAKTSYRYRAGVPPVAGLSLVAHAVGEIRGSIRYWPVRVGQNRPALLLGPLAIAPEHRGEGIGRALVDRTLDVAASQGHTLVLLVGDAPYYSRFGFEPAGPAGLYMPDERPERLLMTALAPDALLGVAGAVRPWRERGDKDVALPMPTLATV